MPNKNDQDASPDLIESIDSLLVQIEETTKAYAPQEDQTVDTNMMITDDGTIAVPAEPAAEDEGVENEAEDTETQEPESSEESNEEAEPIDSIENAQQALDAIDEVEIQAEDLVAQSVDALLDEAEAAVESEVEPEAEPEVEVETEAESEVEAIEEANQDEPIDQAEDVLADSIDDLLSAEAPPEEDNQDDSSATQDTQDMQDSMDLLDEALAHAADDMLEGDFETEDGELVTGESVASAIEQAIQEDSSETPPQENEPESSTLVDSPDQANEPAPEAASETPPKTAPEAAPEAPAKTPQAAQSKAAPTQTASPTASTDQQEHAGDPENEIPESETEASKPLAVPAWFERAIELARPPIDKIDPFKGKAMDVLAATLGSVIVAVLTHGQPLAARALLLVSKPLSKQSVEVRNAVGYIAIWTGFLAMIVWIYLLMFRSPHIPEPAKAPTRVLSVEDIALPSSELAKPYTP